MDQKLYDSYVKILKNELVPALGCTEPIAIAYAAAKAREVLGQMPEINYEDMSYHFTGKNRKIRVYHDPNAELTLRDFFAKLKLNYGM